MARVFSLMTCVMLSLAVEHSVQASDSITVNKTTLKSMVKSMLDDAPAKRRSIYRYSGRGLGEVVAQVLAEQTRMQNLVAASTASTASIKADLEKTKLDLQITRKEAAINIARNSGPGTTFVRWGRKTCPANTTLVYSGVAGGKQYEQKGSGTNRLCLTKSPQFDTTPKPIYYGFLYGAEYQSIGNHQDHDVPCSLCRAPQSTTIMMAATLTCPTGWTAQYSGHLTSAYHGHYATEYVCLDLNPEQDDSGKDRDDNGLLFYYVVTKCDSLPCPQYQDNKVVTCVVCSK